jgi:hypothetical protein
VPQQRLPPVKHISNPAQQPSIQTFSKDSTSPIIVQPQQNWAFPLSFGQKFRLVHQNCGTARVIYIPVPGQQQPVAAHSQLITADDTSTQRDNATATHNPGGPQVPQQRLPPVKHISNPAQQPSIQTFSKDSTSPIIVQPQQNWAFPLSFGQKFRLVHQNCGTARVIYIPVPGQQQPVAAHSQLITADDTSTQRDNATATHNPGGPQVPQQRLPPVKHISNPAQQPSIQTFSKDSTSPITVQVQPQQNGASPLSLGQKFRPVYQNCGTARVIYIPGQQQPVAAHSQLITGPFVISNEPSPNNGNPGQRVKEITNPTTTILTVNGHSSQNGLQSRAEDLAGQTKTTTLNGNSVQPSAGDLTSLTITSTTANEQRTQFQPMATTNDPTGLSAALADPKLKLQTPEEINSDILNSYYTFKLGSPLKDYILKKRKSTRESYTLVEVRIFVCSLNS